MQRRTRYAAGVVTGLLAAAFAALVAEPILDDGMVWFAAGLNGVAWAVAGATFLHNYDRGVAGTTPQDDWALGARVGGLVGGFAGLGASGVLGLVTAATSLRFGALVTTVAFGFAVGMLGLGSATALLHVDGSDAADAPAAPSADD